MKFLPAAVLGSVLAATAAGAVPTQVRFEASVVFAAPGSAYAALGPTVVGSYFFDYDPSSYVNPANPGEGSNWQGYEYLGALYGLTADLPDLSASVPTGVLSVEVYDDGSLMPGIGITSDTVIFASKRNAVSYALSFTGPNATFATTALPLFDTLTGPWTTRTFVVRDGSLNVVLQATVTQLQVSAVPEPSALSSFVFGGLSLWALSVFSRRRAG